MVQNTDTTITPSSQNNSIVELTLVLFVLTVMIHLIFGLPEFANETVDVYNHMKDLWNQVLQDNSDSNPILYALEAVLLIVTMVWLCDRRGAQDRQKLCQLEEAKEELDLKFKRILVHVEHLQNINALNLKSATAQDLPNKLQQDIDEFRRETQQILLYNTLIEAK